MIFLLVQRSVGAPDVVTVREKVVALAAVVRPRLCGAVRAVGIYSGSTHLLVAQGGERGRVEQRHGRILSNGLSRYNRSRSRSRSRRDMRRARCGSARDPGKRKRRHRRGRIRPAVASAPRSRSSRISCFCAMGVNCDPEDHLELQRLSKRPIIATWGDSLDLRLAADWQEPNIQTRHTFSSAALSSARRATPGTSHAARRCFVSLKGSARSMR